MKLTPVIISIILASSTFGYGLASAQTLSTHCTASTQCQPICGDHICAPGEVYAPNGQVSANSTTKAAASTNSTSTPAIQTQINVSANATVTKSTNSTGVQESTSITSNVTATKNTNETQVMASTNSTMSSTNRTQTMSSTNMTGTMSMNGTATMNNTSTAVPPPAPLPSPEKQVASGTASADVKCAAGYQLVLNKFDSRPACVTPEMMAKLVARGWASS